MFADLGATADAERVKTKLPAANRAVLGEMKQFSSSVTIPAAVIDELAAFLRQFPPRQALQLLAQGGWWIPSAADARQHVVWMRTNTPLQYLVPKIVLDQDGNPFQLAQGAQRDHHEMCVYVNRLPGNGRPGVDAGSL